jgi:hypothetical protein
MKNSQKGFFVPLLIIIVAVMAAGGAYYYSQKTTVSNSDTSVDLSSCDQKPSDPSVPPIFYEKAKYNCVAELAIHKNNINLCGKIPNEQNEARGICYESFAIKNKDISLCDKISHTANSYKTYSGVFSQCRSSVAVARQDLALCDTLPDEAGNFGKNSCYALIGGDKKDYGICNKIPADDFKNYRNRCIVDVAQRKGECEVIPSQTSKDYCYLYQWQSIRVVAKDNRCDIYTEPKLAQFCASTRNGELTVAAMCNEIVDSKLKQECLNFNLNSMRINYDSKETTISK